MLKDIIWNYRKDLNGNLKYIDGFCLYEIILTDDELGTINKNITGQNFIYATIKAIINIYSSYNKNVALNIALYLIKNNYSVMNYIECRTLIKPYINSINKYLLWI